MNKKPLTPRKKELCRKFVFILNTGASYSKREIEKYLFPDSKPGQYDRQVREIVATVKEYKPLINLSSQSEMRKVEYDSDYDDAKHQIAENNSRAREILKGNKPLEEFCRAVEQRQYLKRLGR